MCYIFVIVAQLICTLQNGMAQRQWKEENDSDLSRKTAALKNVGGPAVSYDNEKEI